MRNFSQEGLAGIVEIKQGTVSKQERRPDWHISTLRKYVKAMGGELQLVAKFPDRSISLSNIGEIDDGSAASGS